MASRANSVVENACLVRPLGSMNLTQPHPQGAQQSTDRMLARTSEVAHAAVVLAAYLAALSLCISGVRCRA